MVEVYELSRYLACPLFSSLPTHNVYLFVLSNNFILFVHQGLGAISLSETRAAFISCLPQLLLATSNLQRTCTNARGKLDIAGFRPPIHLVASPEVRDIFFLY